MASSHQCILVAGTFDILHDGHYLMLHAAFAHGEFVEIWLSDDAMCAAKSARSGGGGGGGQSIASWATRAANIAAWADSQTIESVENFYTRATNILGTEILVESIPRFAVPYKGRHTEFALSDAMGPAVTESRYTAIVCSLETRTGVDAINKARIERGFKSLAIIQVPLWMVAEGGEKLSSSNLRKIRSS
jgi:phosphopantetheine adenylyltransferase